MNELQALVSEMRKGRAVPSAPPVLPTEQRSQQLPLWEERFRGLPNALARSALFTIGNSSDPRLQFKDHPVFAIKGIEITYTGEELRQDDEDVFLQLVHLARLQPIEDGFDFHAATVLRELKRSNGTKEYTALRKSINRLKANALTVKTLEGEGKGFSGSVVRKFDWEGESRWHVWMEPEILRLFGPTSYTRLDWEFRHKLSGMGKKLHSFYVTHREPYGLYVSTLRMICASRIAVMAKFRYKLKKALDELVKEGFLTSYLIDKNDVVRVVRARDLVGECRTIVEERALLAAKEEAGDNEGDLSEVF